MIMEADWLVNYFRHMQDISQKQ